MHKLAVKGNAAKSRRPSSAPSGRRRAGRVGVLRGFNPVLADYANCETRECVRLVVLTRSLTTLVYSILARANLEVGPFEFRSPTTDIPRRYYSALVVILLRLDCGRHNRHNPVPKFLRYGAAYGISMKFRIRPVRSRVYARDSPSHRQFRLSRPRRPFGTHRAV